MNCDKTGGALAIESGRNAEVIIACVLQILRQKGYNPIEQYVFLLSELREDPIFSDSLKVDFLVRGIPDYAVGLILSSKRQESTGSAALKLYYHIEHAIKKCYPYPTILVMTGDYWTDKMKSYAQNSIDEKYLLKVFFMYDDLLRWAEKLPLPTKNSMSKTYSTLPMFEPHAEQAETDEVGT